MAKKTTANKSPMSSFLKLSGVLTGFEYTDLQGTGVAQDYYDDLVRSAGQEQVNALLKAAEEAGDSETDICKTIWDDEDNRFGPLARNIVLMWYLGSSYPLPKSWYEDHQPEGAPIHEHVVSAAAYKEGLVWTAMGTHARGAKPPGYGSWRNKPVIEFE